MAPSSAVAVVVVDAAAVLKPSVELVVSRSTRWVAFVYKGQVHLLCILIRLQNSRHKKGLLFIEVVRVNSDKTKETAASAAEESLPSCKDEWVVSFSNPFSFLCPPILCAFVITLRLVLRVLLSVHSLSHSLYAVHFNSILLLFSFLHMYILKCTSFLPSLHSFSSAHL